MKNLIFETKGEVGIIKVNRPAVFNVLNPQTVDELDETIEMVINDPKIKVLIIGSNVNFAAGADVKAMIDCNAAEAKALPYSKTYQKFII